MAVGNFIGALRRRFQLQTTRTGMTPRQCARCSTERESAASIEDQPRVCDRLAKRHGFRIVARFEGAGDLRRSGGTAQRAGTKVCLMQLASRPCRTRRYP